MKHCQRCGAEHASGTRFCPACGLKPGAPPVRPGAAPTVAPSPGRLRSFASRLGLLLLCVVAMAVFVAVTGTGQRAPATNATVNASVPTAVEAPKEVQTATAQAVKAPVTLTEMSGDGNGDTALFTATGPWDINYTYDCTGRDGVIVSLDIWNAAGNRISENFRQGRMTPGTGSDVVHLATPGTWRVHVLSICRWRVTVRG